MLDCSVPDFAPAPGIRSYRVSLLMLYLLAIRLAEVNGRLTQEQAGQMREREGHRGCHRGHYPGDRGAHP